MSYKREGKIKENNETQQKNNRKFQRVYFEEFREEISIKEVYEKFLRLANLLRVILRPRTSKDQCLRNRVIEKQSM